MPTLHSGAFYLTEIDSRFRDYRNGRPPKVCWTGALDTAIALIVVGSTSAQHAGSLLSVLTKTLEQWCNVLSNPVNAWKNPDQVHMIMSSFVAPGGVLPLYSPTALRGVEGEVERYILDGRKKRLRKP